MTAQNASNAKTRVAAIGMTHWHSLWDAAYLRHLDAMPDVEIVGIHDSNAETAAHRSSELSGDIPTFTDYTAMLSELAPDFVLALGTHITMAEIAHHLLDNRTPFIMEKPMSFNARELAGVVEQAESTNGFAAVPLGVRSSPIIHHAKQLAEAGTWGKITHFYQRMNRPTSDRYPAWGASWMLDPAQANGGCLRNLGSHGLDCFVYLTGEGDNIEVPGASLSWGTYHQPIEDYASVLVKSASGVTGTIEIGNGFPYDGTDGQMKVAFERAILITDGAEIVLHTADGSETIQPTGAPAESVLRRTIDAAVAGDKPPVSARDCYNAVRLIDLAYLAAGNPYGTAAV
ncbi:MAG: Gfo/Idh/MocA family oxidoreductase [SAR202 cluster bacterium]|jgi:predicted dehydrogenase|nr:Gfo/Idh/MocA family oxidoreductase [SAR202 cluster bacterium]MDP6663519.1 Gfo/Idh/MocA family oxidoreductase [SAR202 cluster bacterium]MDP6801026.1 Gfo/Idh/MocA family oxidoreductase [SAR202 cluster bacterium]MQG59203.1 Gfo/Idh/MocA family oxidoreductase [SAR202 cluster bacterium]MQG69605.1 Gfo/Idh/MocA family oxidoreductase [SAR202 cluster bacterium]|tara:strand:+ start:1007 stop:2038 length:1032 start_codon:yes stop_codon:yes gene_type:complete